VEDRSYAYGADWVSLFDLVIVGARKRQFFTASESPAEDMFDESDVGIERESKAKAEAAAPRNFLPVDPVLRKVMVRAVVTGAGAVSGIDLSRYTVYSGGNAQGLNAFFQAPLAYETGVCVCGCIRFCWYSGGWCKVGGPCRIAQAVEQTGACRHVVQQPRLTWHSRHPEAVGKLRIPCSLGVLCWG
jgi:hypothetical protein